MTEPGSTARSGQTPELDLTPTTPERAPGAPSRRWLNYAVTALIVGVLGFVLFKAVTSATVYFYNVDEAVASRSEIGDRTFRLQGTVATDPVTSPDGIITFEVEYNGVSVNVHHTGAEPTDLFEFGIPVVAEGHWDGDTFESTQLLIKHSETYVADNPDRIDTEIESKLDGSQ